MNPQYDSKLKALSGFGLKWLKMAGFGTDLFPNIVSERSFSQAYRKVGSELAIFYQSTSNRHEHPRGAFFGRKGGLESLIRVKTI